MRPAWDPASCGLATGAALGAGVVAGGSLMHRLTAGNRARAADDFAPDWKVVPDDMGDNDFGIADGGSWDDGSSGGDWSWLRPGGRCAGDEVTQLPGGMRLTACVLSAAHGTPA